MSKIDNIYSLILEDIKVGGQKIQSRNSITYRNTNVMVEFNKTPLISVRKTSWKSALREMEFFLSGSIDIKNLHKTVRHWWKPWVNSDGYLVNSYGDQYRYFSGKNNDVDQIKYLIDNIKNKPFSRRHVATVWNTADMIAPETNLTNCHSSLMQFHVNNDGTLDYTMNQRSADMVLGVPHNFIQHWALLMYIAHHTGHYVGKFTWIGGDVHVYNSHTDIVDEILDTDIKDIKTPNLIYNPTCDSFKAGDFSLDSKYKPIITKKVGMVV